MLRSLRIVIHGLVMVPVMASAQSGVDKLKNSSDAGQQVFDGRRGGPTALDTNRVYAVHEVMMQPDCSGAFKMRRTGEGYFAQPPSELPDSCTTTRVMVSLIVERNGGVTNEEVLGNVCPELGAKALEVFKSIGRCTPGEIRDVPVRVRMIVPVNFKLR
ncbi:MAG: energy transducer TonB [Flavobacteriales bacterium]